VPATPEFPDGSRHIREIKIAAQFNAEHAAAPDRHVHVRGKIAIDLEGKHPCADDGGFAVNRTGIAEHHVHVHVQTFRDHDFFENAPQKKLYAGHKKRAVKYGRLFQLRQKRGPPLNGTGYQLREKGKIKRKGPEPGLGVDFSLINIRTVRDGLKRIKGNAQRQQNIEICRRR